MSTDAVTASAAVGSESLLRFLPAPIRTPERPFRAIAVGWLTAFPASILIAVLGSLMLPDAKPPEFHASGAQSPVAPGAADALHAPGKMWFEPPTRTPALDTAPVSPS